MTRKRTKKKRLNSEANERRDGTADDEKGWREGEDLSQKCINMVLNNFADVVVHVSQ